jgi:hypothetical protein
MLLRNGGDPTVDKRNRNAGRLYQLTGEAVAMKA